MRFTDYSSKLWLFGLLVLLLSLFSLFAKFAFPRLTLSMEGGAIVIFTLLWGTGILALIYGLVSGKPAIEIDEDGILCYRAYYSRIPWEAVVSAKRAPRREAVDGPEGKGVKIYYSEAWRPIDLEVRDLERYATGRLAGIYHSFIAILPVASKPPVSRLRLELTGLRGSSEDAMRVIAHYLAAGQTQDQVAL